MGTPPVTSPPDRKPWLLLGLAALIGGLITWGGSTFWTRELYVGVGPYKTSFRRIALEVSSEMSNKLPGVRLVFCPNKGTEDALDALKEPRIPFVGWLFQRDCKHQDLAAITDGGQLVPDPGLSEAVGILLPLYKSYLQFFVRDGGGPRNLEELLGRRSKLRFGYPPPALATYDRACLLLYRLNQKEDPDCHQDPFQKLGFREVKQADPAALSQALLSGSIDALVAGGPVCPEGTEALSADSALVPIGLAAPMADGALADSVTYPCVRFRKVLTPYQWTYLAARRSVHLSNPELFQLFGGLTNLRNTLTGVIFVDFADSSAWPYIGKGTGGPYELSYLELSRSYPDWFKTHPDGKGNPVIDFIDSHGRVIQFFGSLVAMAGGILTLAKAIANRKKL